MNSTEDLRFLEHTKQLLRETQITNKKLEQEDEIEAVKKLRKKEMLHYKWSEEVYEVIQRRIDSLFATEAEKQLAHKNCHYHNDLCYNNSLVYPGPFEDPLSMGSRKEMLEKSLLYEMETGFKPSAKEKKKWQLFNPKNC